MYWVPCLAGDLVLHMFEEQALLLGYELHLDCVLGQQFVQRLGHRQYVLLSRLHPQRTQVPRLPELRFWKLCQAQKRYWISSNICFVNDKSRMKWISSQWGMLVLKPQITTCPALFVSCRLSIVPGVHSKKVMNLNVMHCDKRRKLVLAKMRKWHAASCHTGPTWNNRVSLK